MRRVLLVSAAITFAIACTDNITEPTPDRPLATAGTASRAGRWRSPPRRPRTGCRSRPTRTTTSRATWCTSPGYGWQAGDVLDIVLTDDPLTHEPHAWTVEVGADGMFHDQTYVVDEGDLNVTFTLVATSRATGRSLTVNFTDSQPQSVTVTAITGTVTQGGSATYTVAVNVTGNNNNCTMTLSVTTPLPAGATASFSGGPVITTNASFSKTLTIATLTTTPAGTTNFTVQVARGANCQGNGVETATGTLVVTAGNVAPVVDAGGPYSGNRNVPISLGGATATDADGDALTYAWTYAPVSGVPAGTTCSFSSAIVLNPTFTCTNVGVFKVTLTVNDGHNPSVSDDAQVTVANGAPTANAGADKTGNEGSPVALTASATDPDGDALTYKWTYVNGPDVDAGATCSFSPDDTQLSPSVTCTDDGTYTLTLTATDPDALTSTDQVDVVLSNVNPNASAGGPPGGYSGNEGSAIQLDGTGDDPGTNDNGHLTFKWTINTTGIDAGGVCTFDDDTTEDPKVTCTDDSNLGHFTVSLVVKDDDGGTSTARTAQLAVNNVKPVADAGGGADGYTGAEGSAIQLAGSGNDPGDNDDPYLTYHWTVNTTGIDAGGTCTFDDADDKNAKVTCTDDSDDAIGDHFKLTLIVSDDEGNASIGSVANLTVTNAGPVADAGGGASESYSGNEGSPVQLHGSATDAGSNDTFTWLWEYTAGPGDLDPGASCSFSDIHAQEPTITCTDDGTVKLTLKVKDDDGAESSDDATLTLNNVDPVADAGPTTYIGVEGSPVQLQGSVTDAGSNDTHTWYWKYVNGATVDAGATCSFSPNAQAEDPTITCTDDGAIELTLKVTDDDGGFDTDVATLNLTNAVPVATAGGPYMVAEGTEQLLAGSANDPGDNDDPVPDL